MHAPTGALKQHCLDVGRDYDEIQNLAATIRGDETRLTIAFDAVP